MEATKSAFIQTVQISKSPLRELTDLRDQLKLGLSEHPPEGGVPAAELAERIKALWAANTVEAAPERTGSRKAARAERPVTARIRAKLGEQPVEVVPEPVAVEVKPEPAKEPEPVVLPLPEPAKPAEGYRQSVIRRRQDRAEQLRRF
jgi:hypothetical protein